MLALIAVPRINVKNYLTVPRRRLSKSAVEKECVSEATKSS